MIFFILLLLFSLIPSIWNLLQAYYYKVGIREIVEESDGKERFYSIIVAIRNESVETIRGLVENLSSLDYENYEVIIVSDDDEEKFKRIVEEVKFPPNFKVIRREKPEGGKAGALNLGCNLAKGDYLVFLDADGRVDKNFLRKLNEKEFDAAAFRISIYNDETTVQKYYKEFTEKVMVSLFKGRYLLGLPIFPNGSAFAIKRKVLFMVGLWKEGVITEDLELGIRLFLHGVKVKYFHDIVVYSMAPFTLYDLYKQIERWSYGSAQLLLFSLKMIKRGIKGLEGFLYAQQWGIYPLYVLTILVFDGLEFLLRINQLLLLLPLFIYGISVGIYALSLGQKEGDIKVVFTVVNASVSGYLKGVLKIPYKWRVTPKEKGEEKRTLNLLSLPFLFLALVNALAFYWIASLILLGFGLIELLV